MTITIGRSYIKASVSRSVTFRMDSSSGKFAPFFSLFSFGLIVALFSSMLFPHCTICMEKLQWLLTCSLFVYSFSVIILWLSKMFLNWILGGNYMLAVVLNRFSSVPPHWTRLTADTVHSRRWIQACCVYMQFRAAEIRELISGCYCAIACYTGLLNMVTPLAQSDEPPPPKRTNSCHMLSYYISCLLSCFFSFLLTLLWPFYIHSLYLLYSFTSCLYIPVPAFSVFHSWPFIPSTQLFKKKKKKCVLGLRKSSVCKWAFVVYLTSLKRWR